MNSRGEEIVELKKWQIEEFQASESLFGKDMRWLGS
jgi:hypothetical protein